MLNVFIKYQIYAHPSDPDRVHVVLCAADANARGAARTGMCC